MNGTPPNCCISSLMQHFSLLTEALRRTDLRLRTAPHDTERDTIFTAKKNAGELPASECCTTGRHHAEIDMPLQLARPDAAAQTENDPIVFGCPLTLVVAFRDQSGHGIFYFQLPVFPMPS
ncbi:MAG: hypothetical protein ACI802_002877 [Candidatus Paceibacteria bacterium]|jgi:hypothetical protein